MVDGEPYTLRGVSTVRRKVFGNLFRNEQGAERLSYFGLMKDGYIWLELWIYADEQLLVFQWLTI